MLVWCKVMGEVLAMELPWRSLASRLTKVENNNVHYMSMFDDSRLELDIANIDEHVSSRENRFIYYLIIV